MGHVFSCVTWTRLRRGSSRRAGRQRHLGAGTAHRREPPSVPGADQLLRRPLELAGAKPVVPSRTACYSHQNPAVCSERDDKLYCRGSQHKRIKYNVYLCWSLRGVTCCHLRASDRARSYLRLLLFITGFFSAPWSSLSIFSNKGQAHLGLSFATGEVCQKLDPPPPHQRVTFNQVFGES